MNRYECALLTAGVTIAACGGQVALSSPLGDAGTPGSMNSMNLTEAGLDMSSSGDDSNSMHPSDPNDPSDGATANGHDSGIIGAQGDSGIDNGADSGIVHTGDSGITDGGSNLLPLDPVDARADVAVPTAPNGLAGFSFVINDVIQTPLACPHDNWQYALPDPVPAGPACTTDNDFGGGFGDPNMVYCYSITSEIIANTGKVPLAYTALGSGLGFPSEQFPPGVDFGYPGELSGVLAPGGEINIASTFFQQGIAAVVGASEPFSYVDAGRYITDEGTIPWPAGVPGSGGSSVMYVAQILLSPTCSAMETTAW
jgi:hypothetical protein